MERKGGVEGWEEKGSEGMTEVESVGGERAAEMDGGGGREREWYRGRELLALAESMVGMSLLDSSASCFFFQRRQEAGERGKESERQLLMSLHFPLSCEGVGKRGLQLEEFIL